MIPGAVIAAIACNVASDQYKIVAAAAMSMSSISMWHMTHHIYILIIWENNYNITTFISGIFNAMSVIGPALGFILGGFMLNIYTDFYLVDSDM